MASKNSMLEFQAVVFAGGSGSRMYPLTETQPKALLPIANKPMLYYSLSSLERAGLEEVIIIAKESHREQITQFVKEYYDGNIRADCHFIDEDCGTADALRQIKDKIKRDFIVMSSDLVTDAPLHHLVDTHRIHGATCTSLIYEIPKVEDGKKVKIDPGLLDYMALVKDRLVYTVTAADVEEKLELRQSLLKRFPNFTLHTNLLNAHLFVFRRWVIDLVVEKKFISSLQSELVPFLAKCQWRSSPKYSISHLIPPTSSETLIAMSTKEIHEEKVKCVVYKMVGGYSGRANTITTYLEVNRQILKGACSSYPQNPRIHPDAQIDPKAQVGNDSLVGNGTKIEERTSVKRTIIGNHCIIGKNVKISNCVIMDHVTIEAGAKLEGATICNNAYLQENCSLKDCEVTTGFVVEKNANFKNEKLAESSMGND